MLLGENITVSYFLSLVPVGEKNKKNKILLNDLGNFVSLEPIIRNQLCKPCSDGQVIKARISLPNRFDECLFISAILSVTHINTRVS